MKKQSDSFCQKIKQNLSMERPDQWNPSAICRRRVPANELKDLLIDVRTGDHTRLEA